MRFIYTNLLAATIAEFVGKRFTANHPLLYVLISIVVGFGAVHAGILFIKLIS